MSKKCSNKNCTVPVLEQVFGLRKSGLRAGKLRSECKACEKLRAARAHKMHPGRSTRLRQKYAKKQSALHNKIYYTGFDLTQKKICAGLRCENPQNKTYADYYKNSGTFDGFASVCKECKWQRDLILKQTFVNGYGGKCTCCGETEIRFLTLEHLNKDGNIHRKQVSRNSQVLMLDVIKQGFPSKYTVLCFNCNCSEGQGKPCPHKIERGVINE